jgi:hypothetical protein
MPNFALLNNIDHKDTRIITSRGPEYGDNVMYAMTFPAEFRSVQAEYPILFHRDGAGERFAVALFGFQQGENLFLEDAGWQARYVPAMIRRQPFLIGYQESKNPAEPEKIRVLSLDMDHPRISTTEGEPLFQPLGGRTEFLEEMADLLESIYAGQNHGREFVAALEAHDLLEPVTFDITLNDGSRNQLLGFDTIDEERLQSLPGETLEEFARQGFLLPVFMVLASTVNIRKLVDRKNEAAGS